MKVELDVNLVNAMIQIIDVASSKGSFVGDDISAVGDVRKVLVQTVLANQPEQGEEEAPTE